MGISLNGLTPAGTYPGLIKTGDNTAISGTPKVLSDGNGNNLPMEVSTTGVNFTNNLTQGGTALQPVLVSGTNIKTINGASLLGSGNIPVVTSPSGVAGAIQFSNGSAFASDASNLFWDDTNNRLGVGTNAPLHPLSVQAPSGDSVTICSFQNNSNPTQKLSIIKQFDALNIFKFGTENTGLQIYENQTVGLFVANFSTAKALINSSGNFGIGETSPTARTHIKGSGSTSATTSLLVQNSAGSTAMEVKDNLTVGMGGAYVSGISGFGITVASITASYPCFLMNSTGGGGSRIGLNMDTAKLYFSEETSGAVYGHRIMADTRNGGLVVLNNTAAGSTAALNSSACLQADSTTKGFLPPRMTTTQKNAIASPAAGLVVYDSTTNKLCCYNGSTWNDLF
jgi:hypothetical protein